MKLPSNRVSPYLQALKSGLQSLAPNNDYVPLRECLAHLTVLSPQTSGALYGPAEIHQESGMPAFVWMERPLAEQSVVLETDPSTDPTPQQIKRAIELDETLGRRIQFRHQSHTILRRAALLPRTRLDVVLRRLKGETIVTATYDRMEPMGHWVRIRLDLRGAAGQTLLGPVTIVNRTTLVIDPGFEHLFTRYSQTPFWGLKQAIEEVTPVSDIIRLSRSQIGPFWFPGITIPKGVPESLNQGLILHSSLQLLGEEIRQTSHADPLLPVASETVPEGLGWFQQRRFAASPNMAAPLKKWCATQGVPCALVHLSPRV